MTVRVLIVDDHPIVRQGLCAVLATQPGLAVVAECGTGEEAVALAATIMPDVVLMDLRLPGLGGVEATEQIVAAGTATAVVVLTTYNSDGDILRAVAAGATGYLLKDASGEELVAGIRTAAAGGTVLAAPVAAKLVTRMRGEAPALTTREIQVLECAARGLSNPETGRELFISEATVKSHMMRIFDKLGVTDRTAAVTTAIARGILSPP
ncbi:response regulator [Nonomuraea sediminis]|uniref:response regulator n=1 Tax=Nonomuraea sediminis TaxID=2835864 RepID=UPI001BDD3947|nr:response regulator transcription factor [Nonomuraea sediminis]